jgi:hypothetical protein
VKIRLNKKLTIILLSISSIVLIGIILIGIISDNVYSWKIEFEIEKMETGYKFIWEEQTRPDFYKYHPK